MTPNNPIYAYDTILQVMYCIVGDTATVHWERPNIVRDYSILLPAIVKLVHSAGMQDIGSYILCGSSEEEVLLKSLLKNL